MRRASGSLKKADSKYVHDARQPFSLARATGKTPKVLITAGLPSYHDAYMREYRTNRFDGTTHHIQQITIAGQPNNNKLEGLNGDIRDRENVMRGLKKPETPIIPVHQIYHDYLTPNEALKGRTPADAWGMRFKAKQMDNLDTECKPKDGQEHVARAS